MTASDLMAVLITLASNLDCLTLHAVVAAHHPFEKGLDVVARKETQFCRAARRESH